MSEDKFYHWKKNIDNKFIAGEDLQGCLKGLKPEMIVVIEKFGEDESFDQNAQKKKLVTDLFLKEVNGASLYKPVVLNKTNARFFAAEFKSDNVWDWLNKPVTMFAQPDRRHGYVVRFRSAPPSVAFDNTPGKAQLEKSTDLATLKTNWESLSEEMRADNELRILATNMKTNFELADLFKIKSPHMAISDKRNAERIIKDKEVESYAKLKTELEAVNEKQAPKK